MKRASIREVLENPEKETYYYVLVTRHYPPYLRFKRLKLVETPIDVWDRKLAPSKKLVKAYKDGKISWAAYERRFRKEVPPKLAKERFTIHKRNAGKKEVVLVCTEEEEEFPRCHTWILLRYVKKKAKPQTFQVVVECPKHRKPVYPLVEAPDTIKARDQILGTTITCPYPNSHEFTVTKILGVTPYPWKPRGVVTPGVTTPKPTVPTEAAPIRITRARSFKEDGYSAGVVLTRGRERLNIVYPQPELRIYRELIAFAKATGNDTLRNAVIAHFIAHGSSTKSLTTGFLQAMKFPEVTESSVGEVLSRLAAEDIILAQKGVIYTRKISPLGIPGSGEVEHKEVHSVLGERVYAIHPDIRTDAHTRLKLEKHFPWYSPSFLRRKPITPRMLREPVTYEWVLITRETPRFQSAEDYHRYGPCKRGHVEKLPVGSAFLLVRTGFAQWLTPAKESVTKAEKMFKFVPTQTVKRQAILGEFKA